MENIILITKDALCKDYLPIYGNKYWKGMTPNIDELAKKGTVFDKFITAAPSTVMAFRAMMTGKFAYEQPYSNYKPKEVENSEDDLFGMASSFGYKGHIIWDAAWDKMVLRYGNCYGKNTIIHSLPNLRQGVGCHYRHKDKLKRNDKKSCDTLDRIINEIKTILSEKQKVFVWIHLPHVLNGRTAYGSDIDLFDKLIGYIREFFNDDNIFISADHGNMNANKGKYCYGFDVNTPSVEIPLITPKINGVERYSRLSSNVDIKTIIFRRSIPVRDYVFSDSSYYAQPQRKIAIYHNNFAYLYTRATKKEELYDVENDRNELCNLNNNKYRDSDRHISSPVCEYYFSPYWDDVNSIIDNFRTVRKKIWREAPKIIYFKERVRDVLKFLAARVSRWFKK